MRERLHIAGLIFTSKFIFPLNVVGSLAGQQGPCACPPFSLTPCFCFSGCLIQDGVLLPSSPRSCGLCAPAPTARPLPVSRSPVPLALGILVPDSWDQRGSITGEQHGLGGAQPSRSSGNKVLRPVARRFPVAPPMWPASEWRFAHGRGCAPRLATPRGPERRQRLPLASFQSREQRALGPAEAR